MAETTWRVAQRDWATWSGCVLEGSEAVKSRWPLRWQPGREAAAAGALGWVLAAVQVRNGPWRVSRWGRARPSGDFKLRGLAGSCFTPSPPSHARGYMDRAFSPFPTFLKTEKLHPPQGPFCLGLRGWGDFNAFWELARRAMGKCQLEGQSYRKLTVCNRKNGI